MFNIENDGKSFGRNGRLAYSAGRVTFENAEQIVGRERRERLSQLAWCGGGCFDSRRRVNSTVGLLVLKTDGMPKSITKTYPKDWAKINARIRERANHRCEECGLADGVPINYRTQRVISEATYNKRMRAAEKAAEKNSPRPKKRNLEAWFAGDYDDGYWAEGDFYPFETAPAPPKVNVDAGVTRVVLHVHHKDRNPSNNRDTNLVCLCLRCHRAKHGRTYEHD